MADVNEAKKVVLADYERDVRESLKIIAKLRRDLGLPEFQLSDSDLNVTPENLEVKSAQVNVATLVKPGDLFGMTQVQAAKTFLGLTGRQAVSLQEIAAALHRGKATEVLIEGDALRNLSSLLSRSDDFISVAKGRWGLSEWYPNKAKRRKSKEAANGDATASQEAAS